LVPFHICYSNAAKAARGTSLVAAQALSTNAPAKRPQALLEQTALLREIFGNPFQAPNTSAFSERILTLAESCFAAFPQVSKDFRKLADALDELGYSAAAAHCRGNLHVKGCHVIDWILGKG
jgi:hypothetical protein